MIYSSSSAKKRLGIHALSVLKAASPLSSIEAALADLMETVVTGKIHTSKLIKVPRPIEETVLLSLTGKAFWVGLLRLCSTPDFDSFQKTLLQAIASKKEGKALAANIVKIFKEDWHAAEAGLSYSNRFGLVWESKSPENVTFRCDILRPVSPESPPMLILDAYAEPASQEYQLLFPHHDVKLHCLQEPVPLDIEFVPELYIDRTNLTLARQKERREYILSTVGQMGNSNAAGVLVLSYKKVNTYLTQPRLRSHLYQHAPQLKDDAVAWAHWYAGRGVNKFSGRDVVALHAPERPRLFEHHLLSALAPDDAGRRKELSRHLRDTELLQMLHRGRQITFAPDDPQRPRVLTAFRIPVTSPKWVNFVAGSPASGFRDHTDNPHHRHAAGILASELNVLLGAVPHICLVVLGLYRAGKRDKLQLRRASVALKAKTRRVKRKAPHLHEWQGDDHAVKPLATLSPFKPLDGSHIGRVLLDLHAVAELRNLEKFSIKVNAAWGGGETRVYASTEAAAEQAIHLLGGTP